MEKAILKIKELEEEFENLKKNNYKNGNEKYSKNVQLLGRLIDRIYPEKNATELKKSLYLPFFIATERTEFEKQKVI